MGQCLAKEKVEQPVIAREQKKLDDAAAGAVGQLREKEEEVTARAALFDGASSGRKDASVQKEKESAVDDILACMAVQTQAKTERSVANSKRTLEAALEVADATNAALEQQSEQIGAIALEIDNAAGGLERGHKEFDKFESWRIFGGKTNMIARKVEGSFDPAGPDSRRHLSERDRAAAAKRRGVATELQSHKKTETVTRRIDAPKGNAQWTLVEDQRQGGRANVTEGLVGRDAHEQAKLEEISANDDRINDELLDIDGLLDQLADRADGMTSQVKTQNARLGDMTRGVDGLNRNVQGLNARAVQNVKRLS